MNKFISALLLYMVFIVPININAQIQKKATDLPNISVIGNFMTTNSESKKSFDVQEIEFSFQHYLYPTLKADIFTALHKNEEGQHEFEIEEAYVTFLDLTGLLFPNSQVNYGLGAILGKKLLNVGKLNPLHPEQWLFVDRPLATQQFLGGTEGLSGEGVQFNYLLPVSFFSQLELGYWQVASHEHEGEDEEEESHSGVEYENDLFNIRLWNGFSLSESQELEIGVSYLNGNVRAQSNEEKQALLGVDVSLTQAFDNGQALKLQTEVYEATYGEEGEKRASQTGGFVSATYKMSKYYQVGARYGFLGMHGDEGENTSQLAFMVTRQLTDVSKLRLQYNTGDQTEDAIYLQFIFGMGPHAHVLQ